MDVVMSTHAKNAGGGSPEDDGRRLKRLEFEMALEIGEAGGRPFPEVLQKAADVAGGEVLFTLPSRDGSGATGLLRLVEGGKTRLIEVRTGSAGLVIAEEADIDADLLGFARASIDVLERLRADKKVVARLTTAAH
jgi:hypothetical protein